MGGGGGVRTATPQQKITREGRSVAPPGVHQQVVSTRWDQWSWSGPWVRSPGCSAWNRAGGAEVMEKRTFQAKARQ